MESNKKKKNKKERKIDSNAYRCNICGKIVPPVRRCAHLIVAHKMSGTGIKRLFTDTGRKFICGKDNNRWKINEDWIKRMEHNDSERACGTKTGYSDYVKIIYTPMGNKR